MPPKAMPPKLSLRTLLRDLVEASDRERASDLARFFKTGKGQYGEGDKFCGITVPAQRRIARRYKHLPLPDLEKLLQSKVHEHRFTALEILVFQYEGGKGATKKQIFEFYLNNLARINNWDLVDTSAPSILGQYLLSRPRRILYRLAKSENLWERRIAIVSTMAFIAQNDLEDTFAIAELLLKDKHDLIHKAVGWMLREAGKRSQPKLLEFLKRHYKAIARTTLRYAIERLPEEQRKLALQGIF